MLEKLPEISLGTKPVVLLVGNGISMLNGSESWKGFINSIQKKELTEDQTATLDKLPFPMQPIVVTDDDVSQSMREKAQTLIDIPLNAVTSEIVRKIGEIAPDVILTTNYTYELEYGLADDFVCKASRSCKYRVKAFDDRSKAVDTLYQYFKVGDSKIWHIHGEAAKPDTMIIGHYYYGRTLSRIYNYMDKLIRRYKVAFAKGLDFQPHSWVDYFMLGDVYTLGFGASLSEMDFWWLVNCKKLNFSDAGGKVHIFEPDFAPEKRLLAEAYGVIISSCDKPDDYAEYYRRTIAEIRRERGRG